MSRVQRVIQWIALLAPLFFITLAFYHTFRAVPIGGGYVVATEAFQALFFILVAIAILLSRIAYSSSRTTNRPETFKN